MALLQQQQQQQQQQWEQEYVMQARQARVAASEVEAGVLDLWPGFAEVHGQEAILWPGDAVYCPAGTFMHLESLPAHPHNLSSPGPPARPAGSSHPLPTRACTPASTRACTSAHAARMPERQGSSGNTSSSTNTAAPQQAVFSNIGEDGGAGGHASAAYLVPGNVMLECKLWASSPALAPRSIGSMELQAARVMERWAKDCAGA